VKKNVSADSCGCPNFMALSSRLFVFLTCKSVPCGEKRFREKRFQIGTLGQNQTQVRTEKGVSLSLTIPSRSAAVRAFWVYMEVGNHEKTRVMTANGEEEVSEAQLC
jgi:hypothetical protein